MFFFVLEITHGYPDERPLSVEKITASYLAPHTEAFKSHRALSTHMDGADSVQLDDGRIVQLKEMGNGCYVEVYVEAENPSYNRGQPEGYERQGGQYLLKPKPVFEEMQMLPVSQDLKLRLAGILDDGIDDDRPEDERREYLLQHAKESWRDDDQGILRDVAEQLVRDDVMLCNRTGTLFTLGEWGRPTGSYVATVADDEANRCPRCGAPKDEFWNCIRSSRRTRVPNKYQCDNCGKTQTGITTG